MPDGPLTSRLQHLKQGDEIIVSRKATGTLVIDNLEDGRNLYLIGTGTGLAPFLSVIKDPETYERFEKVVLLHGSDPHLRFRGTIVTFFASQGFAVLTWDKRGNGGSTGTLETSTIDTFAVDAESIAGLTNAYGESLRERYAYVSDSNGYWRHRRLPDVLEAAGEERLHVLTHPEWWQKEPMSPRERIERGEERSERRARRASGDLDIIWVKKGRTSPGWYVGPQQLALVRE